MSLQSSSPHCTPSLSLMMHPFVNLSDSQVWCSRVTLPRLHPSDQYPFLNMASTTWWLFSLTQPDLVIVQLHTCARMVPWPALPSFSTQHLRPSNIARIPFPIGKLRVTLAPHWRLHVESSLFWRATRSYVFTKPLRIGIESYFSTFLIRQCLEHSRPLENICQLTD